MTGAQKVDRDVYLAEALNYLRHAQKRLYHAALSREDITQAYEEIGAAEQSLRAALDIEAADR